MGEVVVSFRVPEALRQEFYRAVGEVQARTGRKVEMKQVGSIAIALVVAYLRNKLPRECLEPANNILSTAEPVRG